MSRRLVVWLAIVVALCGTLIELLIQPTTGADRLHYWLILGVPAVVALAVSPLLSRWVARRASVAGAGLIVGLCSLALAAATSSAASNAMFISAHDYRLFLVLTLMSSGTALAIGSVLSAPLRTDIARLGAMADQVAAGDLTARSGVARRDEIGTTAAALDKMVAALEVANAEQRQQFAARQHLFTSLGHDLRTPLAAMQAAVEALQDNLEPDPERLLNVIGGQLQAVDQLLGQVVEWSKLESGHLPSNFERHSVTELLDEAVEAMRPLATRSGVHLHCVADGPAWATCDRSGLARVVRNVLDNAIRFAPVESAVRCVVTENDDTVTVTISDGGAGVPAAFVDHAFQPFQRADSARQVGAGNSGLGLAICQAIVHAHRGTITIANTNPGATVTVTLPITPTEGGFE